MSVTWIRSACYDKLYEYDRSNIHNAERNKAVVDEVVNRQRPCLVVVWSNKQSSIICRMLQASGVLPEYIKAPVLQRIVDELQDSPVLVINYKALYAVEHKYETVVLATTLFNRAAIESRVLPGGVVVEVA